MLFIKYLLDSLTVFWRKEVEEMIRVRVEIEFTTQDGVVNWREVYFFPTGEKICTPWQQTAPELGFSAPVESNDRRAVKKLQRLLRAKVGERLMEAGLFHLAE